MPTREHVRLHADRIIELICLLLGGLLVAAGVAVAASVWVASIVGGAVVWLAWVVGAALVVGGVAALLLRAHRTGNGLAARTPYPPRGEQLRAASKDGTELHVEVEGSADAEVTVVFVHGWTCSTAVWEAQREALVGKDVRVVSYDQRGHGRSGWLGMDEGDLGVRQLSDDLEAVIAATAPAGRLVLVGHSMGGMTVMAFTHRHAQLVEERVDAVCFLATTAGPLSATMRLGVAEPLWPLHRLLRRHAVSMITLLGFMPQRMARSLGIGPYLFFGNLLAVGSRSDGAKADTARGLWETPLSAAARALQAVLTHDERDAVPSLDPARVVIVSGDRDRLVPIEDQVELARLIGDARHVIVEGAGHMMAQEAPEVVNAEIVGLLALARGGTHDQHDDVAEVVVVHGPEAENENDTERAGVPA